MISSQTTKQSNCRQSFNRRRSADSNDKDEHSGNSYGKIIKVIAVSGPQWKIDQGCCNGTDSGVWCSNLGTSMNACCDYPATHFSHISFFGVKRQFIRHSIQQVLWAHVTTQVPRRSWTAKTLYICQVTANLGARATWSMVARFSLRCALDGSGLHLAVLGSRSLNVTVVDRLLNSSDRLICKLLVFEHCIGVSNSPGNNVLNLYLQKASSSSVRLYVSGYMKYTNKNSKVIHPQ